MPHIMPPHNTLCVCDIMEREGRSPLDLHIKQMYFPRDDPSDISLRPFFYSLIVLLLYRFTLDVYMISETFTTLFILLLMHSHWQYVTSDNPELNAILHIGYIHVMPRRLIICIDLDFLTQFYYCTYIGIYYFYLMHF